MPEAGKPRLLVLASTYPRWEGDHEPGFVHELSRRLVGRFDVSVVCPHAGGAPVVERMQGVDVQRYRYAPPFLETLVNDGGIIANLKRSSWKWLLVPGFVLGLAWSTWRVVRDRDPDVIHAHWLLPQGLVVALLGLFCRMPPMVVTAHGADLHALRSAPMRRMKTFVVRRAAAITVVSSVMREKAMALGAASGSLHVLPMGADLRDRFVVGDEVVRRDADCLLFVGRLVPKKGLAYLLDALPLVLAERPGVVLKIVGFGPEERSLREKARSLGIEDSVHFVGAKPQAELPQLYREASLFVAPFVRDANGDQEGLPVVLMEAIGCGCSVVAGEIDGIGDLLGEAASRICVAPQDTGALAAAILRALRDPAEAAAIAAGILEIAVEGMDWGSIAARYGDLLMECRGS